jgi:dTDP-4-dehydrorhamnose reductase
MKDILLTGGTGQVGTELQALPWPGDIRLIAPSRVDCDLSDPGSLSRFLEGRAFSAILSVGAYTAVDRAESDVAAAWISNAVAPAIVAAFARKLDVPIIHVSTDYVFDGTKTAPYVETDPVAPINVYGASKEGGEQAIRTLADRHAIIRTSWVVSPHGANFVKTMLRIGAQRSTLRVVNDQRGTPTVAADLAAALQTIALRMLADPNAPVGTFHYCNQGAVTWCGLARSIFAIALRHGGPQVRVEPITTSEYPTPARRPANSTMSTDKIRKSYNVACPPWESSLEAVIGTILAAQASTEISETVRS